LHSIHTNFPLPPCSKLSNGYSLSKSRNQQKQHHLAEFIQYLINSITLGSIYGLIAVGYTMVFGIIGMVNFAHGEVFMIGAVTALIIYVARFYSHPCSIWSSKK
jgi:ABC-type branched-subunit amino acid transport system permease subunit